MIGVSTISPYDFANDSLELRTIVPILTQEIERLLFSKNFAAQAAVGADTVFDAHTKSTEHNRDDPVTSAPSFLLHLLVFVGTYPPVLVPNMKLK